MKAKGPGQSALLLLDVLEILNAMNIPYAIVGAFAASFYGVVRASLDADAIISVKAGKENREKLISELKKCGLDVDSRQGDIDDPIALVVNITDRFKNRVNLLAGIKGMAENVFLRVIDTTFMGSKIRIIGLEDFIAMKIFAGSPKDINNVLGVLSVSLEKINLPFLRELASQYGRDIPVRLESLLKDFS